MFLQQRLTLSKDTPAFVIGRESGAGHIEQLPGGTEVTVVGEGYNHRTMRVQCKGRLYFVFLQDITDPDSSYYLG
jgi:hypothetical protein